MCGIVVGLAFGKLNAKEEKIRQELLRFFTTELLLVTEERGKDATGAAVLFNDGKYVGIKRGEKVSTFLAKFGDSEKCYGSLLKVWKKHPAPAKVFLGHCRAGTVGDKEDNANNHPIKIGNLVGIHNGVIRNHEVIFEKLECKRDGKVDSEAIFRLFEYYTNKGKEPFTMGMLQNIVDRLEGQFAVTLFNADNLEQVPIFRDGRPVEMVLIRKYGILLLISERKFWHHVFYKYERHVNYYNTLHNSTWPSFLADGEIQVEKMTDDTALIFDLSKQVEKDTKIEDLCESEKMVRSNKIWKSTKQSYYSGYGHYYNRYTQKGEKTYYKPGSSTTKQNNSKKKDESSPKKRRVFDSLTNKYKVKIGDKEVNAKTAITLPVDDVTSDKVKVEDKTEYNKNVKKVEDKEEKKIVSKENTKDGEVIEVEMKTYPPEIVEAANKAYEKLPVTSKGFKDDDEMFDVLDLDNLNKQAVVSLLLVGNRASKHGWLQGYMAAMRSKKNEDEKNQRRQRYIGTLKTLVLMLAKFYEKSKDSTSEASALNTIVKERLVKAVNDQQIANLDIEVVSKIFNSSEVKVLKDIEETVKKAVAK